MKSCFCAGSDRMIARLSNHNLLRGSADEMFQRKIIRGACFHGTVFTYISCQYWTVSRYEVIFQTPFTLVMPKPPPVLS